MKHKYIYTEGLRPATYEAAIEAYNSACDCVEATRIEFYKRMSKNVTKADLNEAVEARSTYFDVLESFKKGKAHD